MSANTLLNRYLEALKMSDSSPIDYGQVILDILKYLDYKESGGDADPNATVKSPTLKEAIIFNIQEWDGSDAQVLARWIMELLEIHNYKKS